jgi:hypothetical protein
VIAGDQQSAAPGVESRDRLAILGREPITDIDREQPELVELGTVEGGKNRIRLARGIAIPRGDVIERLALAVGEVCQIVAQQAEAPDMPIVLGGRDGGLQQDLGRSSHGGDIDGASEEFNSNAG